MKSPRYAEFASFVTKVIKKEYLADIEQDDDQVSDSSPEEQVISQKMPMVGGKNIRAKLGEEPPVKIRHTALSQARLAMHSRTVASD